MRKRKPWVLMLPIGIRNNPAWIFIGILFSISGFATLLGLNSSGNLANSLPPFMFNAWGLFLFISGVALITSSIKRDLILERLVLRSLTIILLTYCFWALTLVTARALITVSMIIALVCIFEVRCAVIKLLLKPWTPPEGVEVNEND